MIMTNEKNYKSPLDSIDVSFSNYVAMRKREESLHMEDGVPDYAFDLDYELRRRMEQIPHFTGLCKKISATIETRAIQIYNQQAVAVSPEQYGEIYSMGTDCAKRLGIGTPNIFVYPSPQINAFTCASDTISPMIVLYSGIVDRLKPAELKCVIAHECGHIHNEHTIYQNVVGEILNSGSGILGFFLSVANMALMQFWTRACEITADRAAVICADNVEDAVNVQKKLFSGATFNAEFQENLNLDALKAQLDVTLNNPSRLYEIMSDHPSGLRRIFCMKEFEECEIYYKWRTEKKKPGSIGRNKEETDERCRKLVNIWNNAQAKNYRYEEKS